MKISRLKMGLKRPRGSEELHSNVRQKLTADALAFVERTSESAAEGVDHIRPSPAKSFTNRDLLQQCVLAGGFHEKIRVDMFSFELLKDQSIGSPSGSHALTAADFACLQWPLRWF